VKPIVCAFIAFVTTLLRSRMSLQIEIAALRHQLAVYERSARRPRIHPGDRILWSWIARKNYPVESPWTGAVFS
jgi:hypothetical protein